MRKYADHFAHGGTKSRVWIDAQGAVKPSLGRKHASPLDHEHEPFHRLPNAEKPDFFGLIDIGIATFCGQMVEEIRQALRRTVPNPSVIEVLGAGKRRYRSLEFGDIAQRRRFVVSEYRQNFGVFLGSALQDGGAFDVAQKR